MNWPLILTILVGWIVFGFVVWSFYLKGGQANDLAEYEIKLADNDPGLADVLRGSFHSVPVTERTPQDHG